mgnify:CR=1 FL=1
MGPAREMLMRLGMGKGPALSLLLLAVMGMAIYTSFIKLWPYDRSLSLRHYTFGLVDAGVIDCSHSRWIGFLAAA